MVEPLLSGVNHVALVARDLDATVEFYSDVFDLEDSGLTAAGDERNVILFFPNGSFLHLIDGSDDAPAERDERPNPNVLLYRGEAIDHISLFANDLPALEKIRSRLVARGASTGNLVETDGVVTSVRFHDPDGRALEVTAYNA
jgi:catechol 2,3-dioxygenase-like lactoylglutathione lyase family enzyme